MATATNSRTNTCNCNCNMSKLQQPAMNGTQTVNRKLLLQKMHYDIRFIPKKIYDLIRCVVTNNRNGHGKPPRSQNNTEQILPSQETRSIILIMPQDNHPCSNQTPTTRVKIKYGQHCKLNAILNKKSPLMH